MQPESFTREEFEGIAQDRGLTPRQMRRLIENRLFPRTVRIGLGRGKGCCYVYAHEALPQLETLLQVKQKYPDFNELRWILWLVGVGWEWLWEDLKPELLNSLSPASARDLNRESDLDRLDREIAKASPVVAQAVDMEVNDTASVLRASMRMQASGQPYEDEIARDLWEPIRPAFSQFYGHPEADSLLVALAPALKRENVIRVVENASALEAASTRASVIAELHEEYPRLPIPAKEKPLFYWLRRYVASLLVLQRVLVEAVAANPEIQKALFERSYNNAVAVLQTPDGAAHGKELSECKEILSESPPTLNPPP